MHQHLTSRRVEFADTDMGGIVHFSRFFVFMETAEHELLRAIGADVHFELGGETIGWPRVSASCEYRSPARLGDVLRIRVDVLRKGTKSITYGFTITRPGHAGEAATVVVAEGRVTAVCCVLNDPNGVRAIAIPKAIADRLDEAPRGDAGIPVSSEAP